jgi:hypothetical protein
MYADEAGRKIAQNIFNSLKKETNFHLIECSKKSYDLDAVEQQIARFFFLQIFSQIFCKFGLFLFLLEFLFFITFPWFTIFFMFLINFNFKISYLVHGELS